MEPTELAVLCNKIASAITIKQALAIIETRVRVINKVLPYAGPVDLGIKTVGTFGRWIANLKEIVSHLGINTITTKSNNIIDNRNEAREHTFDVQNFLASDAKHDGTQTDDTIYRSYAEALKTGQNKDTIETSGEKVVKDHCVRHCAA